MYPGNYLIDGVEFSINSKGFRGKEFSEKNKSNCRVISLGGSITFGLKKSYSSELEKLLKNKNQDCEALNFGIAAKGLNPSVASPAAKVTACCSAIPTSNILEGNFLPNISMPVPDGIAAVTPIITVVVAAGTVYIPTVDTPILFFDFNLKVLAIFYSLKRCNIPVEIFIIIPKQSPEQQHHQ